MNRSATMMTVASVAVGGILAYAVYFDYKRRTDANFRKQLRKEKKRVKQSQTPSESSQTATGGVDANDLRSALESVRNEEVPGGPEEKEQYFMQQVGIGEQLCAKGPMYHLPAAMCFYRALRVYPSPVELVVIYEKTVPPPVFQLVMELTNLDVKDRVEGYYTFFPPKAMNVAVETVNVPDGKGGIMSKKVLVVTKDFEAGEVIYREDPIVVVLDADLQGKGTHCSYCLRQIQNNPIRPESDRLHSVYCSSECQTQHKAHSQTLLFTLESPLPAAIAPEMRGAQREERENAQKAFVEYLIQTKRAAPELVARFVARQVSAETAKMLPRGILPGVASEPILTDGGEYSLYDHLERLRYLEVNPADHETRVLKDVLQTALPGLEQFLTEDRHATFIGKMSYNSYGVYFGEGREDKPEIDARPENAEITRTPCGTSKQIGTGFYAVSAYISHNCAPSAKPVFPTGTAQLQLMATRALKKGDEISVAYVDVSQHPGETLEVARRRRRMELARGWRFACTCKRCAEEGTEGGDIEEGGDESRVEDVVTRVEGFWDVPPPVQVSSITSAGIQLADGLVLPSACIFLDGKVFLWNVPSHLWDGWGREHLSVFETAVPKPEILVFGTGRRMELPPPSIRGYLKEMGIQLDIMDTRNACSTYNLLAEEGRRVAAALLPYTSRPWQS
ncbi:uncharacterized protein EDB93DRAFT_1239374 [Suillus bovinus]|uniref:uncharacterized protein n=1 Tax=Suillus bovinus TaxID=48563 RepID=UPI001B86DC3F|nr:uncharacterized protein EDB93DRAFT_1239374 [Suillus bovinus]KAG2155104.1 hypothetical protein EDB93DRAFT_1239374 [Suillus bovinus]